MALDRGGSQPRQHQLDVIGLNRSCTLQAPQGCEDLCVSVSGGVQGVSCEACPHGITQLVA
jgi:hypothetical protein